MLLEVDGRRSITVPVSRANLVRKVGKNFAVYAIV